MEIAEEKKIIITETNFDFEVRSLDSLCINESQIRHSWYHNLKYFGAGIFFWNYFSES
jgi:hypothetical protein